MSQWPLWVGFTVAVVALVAVDLLVTRTRREPIRPATALWWSAFWIALSIGAGSTIWALRGRSAGVQFFTGYLLEKSLSVDNLFVFLLIFQHFRVRPGDRHRVLTWGILGALLLRAGMIFGGLKLIHLWHPIIYVFGAFLLYTGVRSLTEHDDGGQEEPWSVRLLRRRFTGFAPQFVLALVAIEISDILFAFDSIPAVLAVSQDPFIVYSSNILAILGLRALFFALSGLLEQLRYLKYGLGALLIAIGLKVCADDLVHLPGWVSFALTATILGITIVASLTKAPPRATA